MVVVAIGFGVELPHKFPLPINGYWDNHPIKRVGRFSSGNPGSVLVSGCGDGALIDVLRATFDQFEHDKILQLVPELLDQELKDKLLKVESDAQSQYMTMDADSFLFTTEYEQLLKHIRLSDNVKSRLDRAVKVTFNSPRAGVFQLRTSILNRVLVQLLVSNKLIAFRHGKVVDVDPLSAKDSANDRYRIKWKTRSEEFDEVILRFGVSPERHFRSQLPDIFAAGESTFERIANLEIRSSVTADLGRVLDERRSRWKA